MRLVYVSNSRMPTDLAHGVQIMQMCSAFAKRGAEVELLVPKRVHPVQDDPFIYYDIERNFKVTKVPCLDFLYIGGSKIIFFTQLLSFLVMAKLKLVFGGRGADVIYSRELLTTIFFKNTMVEMHSLPKNRGWFYSWLLRRARGLVVLTGAIKERLVVMGVRADKIMVAPDAVNLKKFDIEMSREEARAVLGLPTDKKLVGYVGMLRTLGMEKGIDVAVESLAILADRPEITLVLVGGHDEDIEHYRKMAREKGVEDRLIATGMVKHDLVPKYLKAFDVLIAPFPKTEHYSFYMSPLKIFEYMASGRPIITTDLPSLREVLTDGKDSLLVAPGSANDLARALVRVLDDGGLSSRLARGARELADEYTWEKRAGRILEFADVEKENTRSFSSAVSVGEYSKRYLRAGEEYVMGKYMSAGARVLDVGCGAGRTTSYIFERGAEVVGIDIAPPLIAKAKLDYPNIDFGVMDVKKLDFADGSFDTVFFSFNGLDNLSTLEDRLHALREMKRVLKPGGHLIYSSHNGLALPRTRASWKIILKNLSRLRFGPHWREEDHGFGRLTQFYDNVWREVANLHKAGLKNIQVIGNSKKFLRAPKFVLSFVDKFPIYVAQK